ncbi:hypothetical protein GUITHDRAFT_149900 [Guillardia theta CCMP2712]|uniref:SMODS and SLOG-associating 2TM effector domain-containing protein n=2 Tax=Guillardia theta TaxID=55529 RepID=L1K371_GUITC|nr:hypothetical protein GUITHDRAFT_149900 [Guillardia theta CCMP2712]EKX54900.1 hypothetical protein GUITHDRAFT_149900 [Guillardia theta CCMP2712]|eukprot:XP_005841880.1 hypothetical protein GUITHDRAFT_149900 [Guillardia theta CCMP2712]
MQLRAELIESAGMEQTSFMAKYPPRVFTHHQNQDCPPRKQSYKADEMQDNHHSPLPSHQYMELRVNTMIKFFRRRLPLYKFRVALFNWLIIVLIAAAAAVANIESAEYGAICMALATAVVSWMEFDGTRQKLSRYNKSLVSLNNIVTWWNSISDSHKASVESVSLLVMQVESVIAGESDAWLAVPMTKGIEENKQKLEASYDITTRRGSFL